LAEKSSAVEHRKVQTSVTE